MATIWDDKNHSSGEQFILSKTANSQVKKAFNDIEFPCSKISEKEYNYSKKQRILYIPENHKSKSNDIIFYFESKGICYKVIATSTLNNSNFTWSTVGTSTNRVKMTIIKETCSLVSILKKKNINALFKTDEELILAVKNDYGIKDISDYWKNVYFTSALAHANLISKIKTTTGLYLGERQQEEFSKIIYDIAKILTNKAADNWNPSDIWLLNNSKAVEIKQQLLDFKKEISKSNLEYMELAFKYKMMLDDLLDKGYLIGISLKQIDNGAGKCNLITYDSIKSKSSNMSFEKLYCYIRETKNGLPAYGELRTKSGFNIKWGGRANATKANINLEGQMSGSTHQLGAIDSKVVELVSKQKGFKIYKDSDFSEENLDDLFKKMQNAMKVFKSKQNSYDNYFKDLTPDKAILLYGFVEIKRFIACVSVFEFIDSFSSSEIQDFFLLAKKIDKINPNYYILH